MTQRLTPVQLSQLGDFAKYIAENPVLPLLKERINYKLFDRFMTATTEEKEVINAIIDNQKLFYNELNAIIAETTNLETNEDE